MSNISFISSIEDVIHCEKKILFIGKNMPNASLSFEVDRTRDSTESMAKLCNQSFKDFSQYPFEIGVILQFIPKEMISQKSLFSQSS